MGGGTIRLPTSSSSSSILPNRPRPNSSTTLNFPVSSLNTSNNSTAAAADSLAAKSCCCSAPGGLCTRLLAVSGEQEYVFGPVPDLVEVETSIASLQNFMEAIPSSSGLELNLLDCCSTNVTTTTLLSHGYERVRDAFNLLQTDPSIKSLVVSLSSDKAVWDAVMNNEVFMELQQSAQNMRIQRSSDDDKDEPDITKRLLDWIIEITKAKVGELIHNFQLLMNERFSTS